MRDSVLDALAGLIRTPSVNPTLAPDEGAGETAVVEFACDWLRSRGVEAWSEEVVPGRPNAVGRVGSGESPILVLCAHVDTVGTEGMTIPPFEPRIEGNRMYGRGSYDMKGGAAACMATAAALAAENLAGTVLLALVCDEEYASIGASDFVKRHRADACIVTEPSPGSPELVLAHKGFVWLVITTHGTAAHGSRWDLGVSAISKMARVVTALDEFDATILRARTHPLVGPASMHCAQIAGGSGLSTYAEKCVLQVERRTLPGEVVQSVIEEITRTVNSADPEAEVSVILDRPPLECAADSPLANAVRNASTNVIGQRPRDAGVAFWMDAAIFAAAGIPTVNYGPSGEGAHAAVEWTDIDSVVNCAAVLTGAARIFCNSGISS